jgi:PilZ domain
MPRVDRRLFPRLHEGFEMAVKGVDMFGAPFLEKTRVLNLSREGLCCLLLRPVAAGGNLEFACQSSYALSEFWVVGRVVWVSERFDGYQLVGLSAKAAQNSEARLERRAASVA